MPSFDTVCEPNLVEVKNAVDTTAKEIATRFDFKGTSAAIALKDKEITLFGDADFQITQVDEVLRNKLAKRNVDVRYLDKGDGQKIGGVDSRRRGAHHGRQTRRPASGHGLAAKRHHRLANQLQ